MWMLVIVWGALHCLKHLPSPASSLLKGAWKWLLWGKKCFLSQSYDNQNSTLPPSSCNKIILLSPTPALSTGWLDVIASLSCQVRVVSCLRPIVSSAPVMGYTPGGGGWAGWSCMHWEAIFILSVGACIFAKKIKVSSLTPILDSFLDMSSQGFFNLCLELWRFHFSIHVKVRVASCLLCLGLS